ncbi:MAG: hypothetical protein MUE85_15650, partial [Microscillaceae bacterium]|nr:hypothetical protein [Microscillaceae bacterium]
KIQDSVGLLGFVVSFLSRKKKVVKKSVFIITLLSISYRKPVCKYSKKSNIRLKFLQWELLNAYSIF